MPSSPESRLLAEEFHAEQLLHAWLGLMYDAVYEQFYSRLA